MTLPAKAGKLWKEYRAAHEWTRKHMRAWEKMRRNYHGRYYIPYDFKGFPTLENHYFDWTSWILPRAVYENPKFRLTTRSTGDADRQLEAAGLALNQWVEDHNWRKFLVEGPVLDAQFAWGVTLTCQEADPSRRPIETSERDPATGSRISIQPRVPKVYRVSPERYFSDALAISRDDSRFQGHVFVRDKEDVMAEAKASPKKWNLDVISELPTDGTGDIQDWGERYFGRDRQGSDVTRDEVWFAEIWVPEIQLDGFTAEEGFHGTVFTLPVEGADGDDQWARPPRPYYGPPSGPYTMYGIYSVPDDPHHLAPLVVVEEQIRDLNKHAWAISRSASKYKKLVFVDSTDPQLQQRVQDAEHHSVVPMRGFDRAHFAEAEIGGATSTQYEYLAHRKNNLDRVSSFHDTQRGVAATGATATAVSEASTSSDTRVAFIEQQIEDAVLENAKKVLWYIHNDNRVIQPLGPKAVEALRIEPEEFVTESGEVETRMPRVIYQGGAGDDGELVPFDELQLKIDTDSMKRTDAGLAQARTLQGVQMLAQYAQMMPSMPWIDWKGVLEDAGYALNLPQLSERIRWDVLEQVANQTPLPDLAERAPRMVPEQSGGQGPTTPPPAFPGSAGPARGTFPSPGAAEGGLSQGRQGSLLGNVNGSALGRGQR